MTGSDDQLDRRSREIEDAVDKAWAALADLDIEAKALAVHRLIELVALEEASHIPEPHEPGGIPPVSHSRTWTDSGGPNVAGTYSIAVTLLSGFR